MEAGKKREIREKKRKRKRKSETKENILVMNKGKLKKDKMKSLKESKNSFKIAGKTTEKTNRR